MFVIYEYLSATVGMCTCSACFLQHTVHAFTISGVRIHAGLVSAATVFLQLLSAATSAAQDWRNTCGMLSCCCLMLLSGNIPQQSGSASGGASNINGVAVNMLWPGLLLQVSHGGELVCRAGSTAAALPCCDMAASAVGSHSGSWEGTDTLAWQ